MQTNMIKCPAAALAIVLLPFLNPVATAAIDPVDRVDPMIGTAVGSCMPGPCLPHASIYPSPDTLAPRPSGYNPQEPIVGFAQLHTQGTGGKSSYGNFLISPQIGLQIQEKNHASPKAEETAKACRYGVRLAKYNIDCAVAPSRHSALYRFTFPESSEANILIDVARKVGGTVALQEGTVKVDAKNAMLSGGGVFDENWVPGQYKLYFAAKFSRQPDTFGVWKNQTCEKGVAQASGKQEALGGFFGFATKPNEPVFVKIAVSFKSVEQAAKWLEEEIPGWDMDGLEAKAKAAWNEKLRGLEVEGASDRETAKIYTALWHALVQPRDRSDDHGDGTQPFWDDHYTLWDSWKTLFPLLAIVDPATAGGVVNSFIMRHKSNPDGYVGTAFVQGVEYRTGQGGDEADNVIADAYLKNIHGIQWEEAYQLLRHHADTAGRTAAYRELGYVPAGEQAPYCRRMKSASGTLAFAANDFSVAQVARGLGKTADADRFRKRSENWKKVWDDTAQDSGFSGFPRSRNRDGSFTKAGLRKNYNVDFYEAISWEAAYAPTFAGYELIEKMGGREKFLERLQFALQNNLIDFGNEPSFMTPWLFAALGRPDLTSFWAAAYKDKYRNDQLPGDDDQGAMSSMYLFLVSGFFPFAGQDAYYLHGPSVPKIAYRLANGKTFTIRAVNASEKNIYIQSATLNGTPLKTPMLHHADILNGGTLEFIMGEKPGTQPWEPGESFKPPPR